MQPSPTPSLKANPGIETFRAVLPHGIELSCRAAGPKEGPVLLFLHGFPEAAFVWDELLLHFAKAENGGYRCVAPNLRGYEHSSRPAEVGAYRAKFLCQDIYALMEQISPKRPLAALVAHDWGGAVAWSVANQRPELMQRLVIVNSPHPGTFWRELKNSPEQQAASAYMNFLVRPDSAQLLAEDHFKRLWPFLMNPERPTWLTDEVMAQYEHVWSLGLEAGCHYYRASPLRPETADDKTIVTLELPRSMLTISVPTLVLWGLKDIALRPGLLDGLEDYVPQLTLRTNANASHWMVHEEPAWVAQQMGAFLNQ